MTMNPKGADAHLIYSPRRNFLVFILVFLAQASSACGNHRTGGQEPSRLIFVKTHKTGGSTVATLLHRLARIQNASCFVPPQGFDAHKWELSDPVELALARAQRRKQAAAQEWAADPQNFSGQISGAANFSYDMWTSHSVYDHVLHQFVPSTPTSSVVLISIVRDPLKRWLSAFEFYDLPKRKGYVAVSYLHSAVKDKTNSENTGQGQRWWHRPGTGTLELYSSSEVAAMIIDESWSVSTRSSPDSLVTRESQDNRGNPELSPRSKSSSNSDNGNVSRNGSGTMHGDFDHAVLLALDIGGNGRSGGGFAFPWSFNGMAFELAGTVHGPLKDLNDAQRLSNLIASGNWSVQQRGTTSKWCELVMVLERFDESLLALQHVLGLTSPSFHSFTAFSDKVPLLYGRAVNPGQRRPSVISDLAMQKLKDVSFADVLLYDAAQRRLDAVLECIDEGSDGAEDCGCGVDNGSSTKRRETKQKSGSVAIELDTLKSSVQEAHRLCSVAWTSSTDVERGSDEQEGGGDDGVLQVFCSEMVLSDSDWQARMNVKIDKSLRLRQQQQLGLGAGEEIIDDIGWSVPTSGAEMFADAQREVLEVMVLEAEKNNQQQEQRQHPNQLHSVCSVTLKRPVLSDASNSFTGIPREGDPQLQESQSRGSSSSSGGISDNCHPPAENSIILRSSKFSCSLAIGYGSDDEFCLENIKAKDGTHQTRDIDPEEKVVVSTKGGMNVAELHERATTHGSLAGFVRGRVVVWTDDGCSDHGRWGDEARPEKDGQLATLPSRTVIAIVSRGGCSFRDKALRLQKKGARAVIIVDYSHSLESTASAVKADVATDLWSIDNQANETDGGSLNVADLGRQRGVNIPVVMIPHKVGTALADSTKSATAVKDHLEVTVSLFSKGNKLRSSV